MIRIGSVGIGRICRGAHMTGIDACPELTVSAACDIKPEALAYAKARYALDDAHCFSRHQALVACDDVDALDICTSNDAHFEVACAAAEAGKPFALEKPVSLDAARAQIIAQKARDAGVKTMVCFSYRYKSAVRYARELIARGALGRIYHVDAHYAQAWGLPAFDAKRVWRFSKEIAGSGALGDLGSHMLDLTRFVTGQEYTRVVAHLGNFIDSRRDPDGEGMLPCDVDDFSNYMAEMSGGASATFRITRFAYGRGNYQRVEFYGERGALIYTMGDAGYSTDALYACLEPLGRDSRTFERVNIPARCERAQMTAFHQLLTGAGDGLDATIEDGLVNQRALDAILRAAREERWVDVN